MTAENLLIRVLGSCETMANASVVCSDETGASTQNIMSVVAGSIGIHAKIVHNLRDNNARATVPDQEQDVTETADEPQIDWKHTDDFAIEQDDINMSLSSQLKRLFNQLITISSTAFEDTDPETKELVFAAPKPETTLPQFAKDPAGKTGRILASRQRLSRWFLSPVTGRP